MRRAMAPPCRSFGLASRACARSRSRAAASASRSRATPLPSSRTASSCASSRKAGPIAMPGTADDAAQLRRRCLAARSAALQVRPTTRLQLAHAAVEQVDDRRDRLHRLARRTRGRSASRRGCSAQRQHARPAQRAEAMRPSVGDDLDLRVELSGQLCDPRRRTGVKAVREQQPKRARTPSVRAAAVASADPSCRFHRQKRIARRNRSCRRRRDQREMPRRW